MSPKLNYFLPGLASLQFLALNSLSAPSLAAEKIVVRYGSFEASLPVEDLRTYAKTKKASAQMQDFLRFLSRDDRAMLQEFLQVKIPIDIVAMDKLLDTELGKQVLSTAAQITARADNAGIPALRAAMILGSQPPEGLGPISFLKAYPSENLTIDIPQALKVIKAANIYPSASTTDNLSSTPVWQFEVQYQTLATQNKQYNGCLFGDSISAGVGNTLGEHNYNYALDGLSTVSLVEQLKLISTKVKCQKAVVAIGTNDALYKISNEMFIKKLQEAIALVQSMGAKQVVLIPAFYSTVAASRNLNLAGPIPRVEEINALIRQVATTQQIPIAASSIQTLFKDQALREDLTNDGVHLNNEGLEIYRQALSQVFNTP